MSGNEADDQDNPYTSSDSPSGDEAITASKWTCRVCGEKDNYELACIRRGCAGTQANSSATKDDEVPGMVDDVASSSDEEPRGFVRSPSEEEAQRHWNAERTPDKEGEGPEGSDDSDSSEEGGDEGEGKSKENESAGGS
ncbi:hypothetical protein HBI56_222860 [Parastagonospora nodorum]|uniref:Uncharacterized protein n=1 Tax=Phaeosphaeria nodorum (strain SN15 / ATCC MYA-4574 / FGSC 10173) TaxID=321614 RepID=A0A7U2F057_PHANO|nr:hypothetical protein HBH56_148110 [Parastagonospora nodorum]QRC94084.1 hypothetical protein JI435_305240 [Parastagonospora nodorum SN15]KAH3923251.1 hypothetical protein HBH54_212750 [Parastagonospora nodorum]KAH3945879.1 hypothetical protein HBH53_135570 [Parastagonospora nodorum]KAH3984141.1 hypothetical protein HBH52_064450 [Parastagonospora nodorum]